MRRVPLLAACLLAGLSVFLTSAKCIENVSLRKGAGDNWLVNGEIHNETDIQGVDMRLQGMLFDENGRSYEAVADTVTCPQELSPGSLSVFTLNFIVSPGMPEPVEHRVTVVGGKALDQPLPKLSLISSGTATQTTNGLQTIIKYRANQPYDAPLSACLAMYDGSGDVVKVVIITKSPGGFDPPKVDADATITSSLPTSSVPAEATQIRYWLWLQDPEDQRKSDHQAFVSPLVPIQRPPQFERR